MTAGAQSVEVEHWQTGFLQLTAVCADLCLNSAYAWCPVLQNNYLPDHHPLRILGHCGYEAAVGLGQDSFRIRATASMVGTCAPPCSTACCAASLKSAAENEVPICATNCVSQLDSVERSCLSCPRAESFSQEFAVIGKHLREDCTADLHSTSFPSGWLIEQNGLL